MIWSPSSCVFLSCAGLVPMLPSELLAVGAPCEISQITLHLYSLPDHWATNICQPEARDCRQCSGAWQWKPAGAQWFGFLTCRNQQDAGPGTGWCMVIFPSSLLLFLCGRLQLSFLYWYLPKSCKKRKIQSPVACFYCEWVISVAQQSLKVIFFQRRMSAFPPECTQHDADKHLARSGHAALLVVRICSVWWGNKRCENVSHRVAKNL